MIGKNSCGQSPVKGERSNEWRGATAALARSGAVGPWGVDYNSLIFVQEVGATH